MFFLYVFDFQSGHDCRTTRIIGGPVRGNEKNKLCCQTEIIKKKKKTNVKSYVYKEIF